MADSFALGEEIAALAAQVNVATHGLLTRIRRFDADAGWYTKAPRAAPTG